MIEMDDHEIGGHHSAVAIEIDQRQAGKMSEPIANGLLVCRSESESGNIFDWVFSVGSTLIVVIRRPEHWRIRWVITPRRQHSRKQYAVPIG
jgi:hypothetical protein